MIKSITTYEIIPKAKPSVIEYDNTIMTIVRKDGTVKDWSEIDWDNVNIKYCKIEKMTSILNEGTNHPETALAFEKNFE